jgi:hypothetical protein
MARADAVSPREIARNWTPALLSAPAYHRTVCTNTEHFQGLQDQSTIAIDDSNPARGGKYLQVCICGGGEAAAYEDTKGRTIKTVLSSNDYHLKAYILGRVLIHWRGVVALKSAGDYPQPRGKPQP